MILLGQQPGYRILDSQAWEMTRQKSVDDSSGLFPIFVACLRRQAVLLDDWQKVAS